jgi:hypothetical protein
MRSFQSGTFGWQRDLFVATHDAFVVHQRVAKDSDLVERTPVLTFVSDPGKSVDEVTVEDEGHVVEEERFEGFRRRVALLKTRRKRDGERDHDAAVRRVG